MANKTTLEMKPPPPDHEHHNTPYTPTEAKARFRVAASQIGLRRVIQAAPWKSVGIALGAGLVLGYSDPVREGLAMSGKFSLKRITSVLSQLVSNQLSKPAASRVTVDKGDRPDLT
jgi:hypothetical protein